MQRLTKKKLGIPLALLACLVMALVLNVNSRKAEPRYHGVPLSSWMRAGSNGVDEIDVALGDVGPSAIPCLIQTLRAKDSMLWKVWSVLWPKLPAAIQKRYEDPDHSSAYRIRRKAMLTLERWGPEAEAALPELINLVARSRDLQSRLDALPALAEVGAQSPETVSVLLQALSDRRLAHDAAFALARLGTNAKPAIPLLMESIRISSQKPSPFEQPRFEIMALAAIGPEAAVAVPCLIPVLSNSTLRGDALAALKAIGPGATAVPALIEILQSGKPEEQYAAAECLIGIGPPARPAIPDLELTRRDENPVLRVLAAVALAQIRGQAETAVPELVNEIKQGRYDPNRHPYWGYHVPNRTFVPPTQNKFGVSVWHLGAAAWHLGELGPAASEALPVLKDQLRGGVDWQSLIAAEAIWKITGQADLVLPHLLQALDSRERYSRILAIRLLGEMGPAAQSALPRLLKLQGASITMRREVTATLRRIDPETAAKKRR